MQTIAQAYAGLPVWLQTMWLLLITLVPFNMLGMVLLYWLKMSQMREGGLDEDKVRDIAHAQALITYAELEERRQFSEGDGGFERRLM